MKSIYVLLLTDFLLFFLDFHRANISLELSFLDSMIVLSIFESNLRLFFKGGELISVLEHQVHQTLHVDLDLNLMLFLKVLVLSLLVS